MAPNITCTSAIEKTLANAWLFVFARSTKAIPNTAFRNTCPTVHTTKVFYR